MENARLRQLLEDRDKSLEAKGAPLWSSVVANGGAANRSSGGGVAGFPIPVAAPVSMKLEYIPPVILNDRVVVSPPKDVEEFGQSKWRRCIVGHFLDKKLSFTAVRNIAMRIWEKFGICDVLSNEKGFFFFLFEGEKFHQLLERVCGILEVSFLSSSNGTLILDWRKNSCR